MGTSGVTWQTFCVLSIFLFYHADERKVFFMSKIDKPNSIFYLLLRVHFSYYCLLEMKQSAFVHLPGPHDDVMVSRDRCLL